MKFLVLLILFIIIFYLGINAVLRNVFRFMSGGEPASRRSTYTRKEQHQPPKDRWYVPKQKKKKVIDNDEGEYVEYEEIK